MATSRTGTAVYLRNRRRVLHRAKANGLTHCPGYELRDGTPRPCGRPLDYDTPLQPGSAETDHIIDHQYGGTDDTNNLRVICRTCNLERNRHRPPVPLPEANDFPVSRDWLTPGGGTPGTTALPPLRA